MNLRSLVALTSLLLLACGGDTTPSPSASTPDAAATSDTTTAEPEPDPDPVDPPGQLGPEPVGHLSFTITDTTRDDRTLLVDVWYPADPTAAADATPTSYPLAPLIELESEVAVAGVPVAPEPGRTLLVFSHGYGGIHTQSIELIEALASHGFVVAAPEHTGNAQSSLTDTFDEAAAHRVPDVTFLIDTMLARAADPEDLFHDRLDPERVGVVGHSFGGMTALGTAAGWAGAPPDPRVGAIAPISAVIDGDLQLSDREGPNAGFTAEQLATVTLPVLLLGGTEDVDVPIANNGLAFDQLVAAPSVYRVDILGANHTHFANVCAIGDLLIELGITQDLWPDLGAEDLIAPYEATCGPDAFPIDEATRLQSLFVVAFFRRHLHDLGGYDAWLTPDYAATEPAVELTVRHLPER